MVKTNKGFTIVELLIVIVVIAILAAVTVVAYNGIQNRAEQAVLKSNISSTSRRLEAFKTTNDTPPSSIMDCPSPAVQNLCLQPPTGTTYSYTKFETSGPYSSRVASPSYELTVFGNKGFSYFSPAEMAGTGEFMQFTDMAPMIDRYGLRKYEISFDIKSANTSAQSGISVYFQNGSTTRYGGLSYGAAVTTEFSRHSVIFTPTNGNMNVAQAMLAFYGVYNTGNVPTVKNLAIKLAD